MEIRSVPQAAPSFEVNRLSADSSESVDFNETFSQLIAFLLEEAANVEQFGVVRDGLITSNTAIKKKNIVISKLHNGSNGDGSVSEEYLQIVQLLEILLSSSEVSDFKDDVSSFKEQLNQVVDNSYLQGNVDNMQISGWFNFLLDAMADTNDLPYKPSNLSIVEDIALINGEISSSKGGYGVGKKIQSIKGILNEKLANLSKNVEDSNEDLKMISDEIKLEKSSDVKVIEVGKEAEDNKAKADSESEAVSNRDVKLVETPKERSEDSSSNVNGVLLNLIAKNVAQNSENDKDGALKDLKMISDEIKLEKSSDVKVIEVGKEAEDNKAKADSESEAVSNKDVKLVETPKERSEDSSSKPKILKVNGVPAKVIVGKNVKRLSLDGIEMISKINISRKGEYQIIDPVDVIPISPDEWEKDKKQLIGEFQPNEEIMDTLNSSSNEQIEDVKSEDVSVKDNGRMSFSISKIKLLNQDNQTVGKEMEEKLKPLTKKKKVSLKQVSESNKDDINKVSKEYAKLINDVSNKDNLITNSDKTFSLHSLTRTVIKWIDAMRHRHKYPSYMAVKVGDSIVKIKLSFDVSKGEFYLEMTTDRDLAKVIHMSKDMLHQAFWEKDINVKYIKIYASPMGTQLGQREYDGFGEHFNKGYQGYDEKRRYLNHVRDMYFYGNSGGFDQDHSTHSIIKIGRRRSVNIYV